MEVEIEQNEFSLYIDFIKSEGDPSRVFRAMASLIDSFSTIDQQLVGIIGEETNTEMVLDEVTTGSLRSKLRSLLLAVPDELFPRWKSRN